MLLLLSLAFLCTGKKKKKKRIENDYYAEQPPGNNGIPYSTPVILPRNINNIYVNVNTKSKFIS